MIIVIMSRIPVAGRTKTRLMPDFSPEDCKRIHEDFLQRYIREIAKLQTKDVYIYYTTDGPLSVLQDLLPDWLQYRPQVGADLGERMIAVVENFARARPTAPSAAAGEVAPTDKLLFLGIDSPEIDAARLRAVERGLDETDIVIGPSFDGGYHLIGLRISRFVPALFQLGADWGGPDVYAKTLKIALEHERSVLELSPLADIDTAADYRAWQARMAAAETAPKDETF